MSAPILLLDTIVEIQKTLGAAKTITAVTKASPPVATSTAHGLANGTVGILSMPTGMSSFDKRMVRLANQATNSFEFEGLDSTGFPDFVAGTFTPITAFDTFAIVTSFSIPEPQPNRQDSTTVHVNTKREIFGLDDAVNVNFNMQADPKAVAVINLRTASKAKATRGFRVTLQDGTVLLFNAYCAGGRGLDGGTPGTIMTAQAFLTLAAEEQYL